MSTTDPLHRYRDWNDVPRDLRSAEQLTTRGFRDLGPPVALVATPDGDVPLHSTSEARRRRDGMWGRGARGDAAAPAAPHPAARHDGDLVGRLARGAEPRPGDIVRGTCRRCERTASGLIDGVCPRCRREARGDRLRHDAHGWLEALFADRFVILDTETTGLGRHDEIIEVGVVDASGATLLESLVWPRGGRVPSAATRVHGLHLEDLHGAPTWPAVLDRLRRVTDGRRVLAWNAPFDERMARQSSRAWKVRHGLPAFECAMQAYALALGHAGGRCRLERAATEQGVRTQAQTHRSADDARLTLAVLRSLAGRGD